MPFDPSYLLYIAPAVLLAIWAQGRVRATYAEAQQIPSQLTGAATARYLLDAAGLSNVPIEAVPGQLTDHYDPRAKVLRLSQGVYGQHNLAAVGIAAHEAGHAMQDAQRYVPLVLRNLAVPLASAGGGMGMTLLIVGSVMAGTVLGRSLALAGLVLFAGVAIFQIINLPVEFDASRRAKQHLLQLRIVSQQDLVYVDRVLDSAAWTYVAATLQSVLMLLYFLSRMRGSDR